MDHICEQCPIKEDLRYEGYVDLELFQEKVNQLIASFGALSESHPTYVTWYTRASRRSAGQFISLTPQLLPPLLHVSC